MVLLSGTVTFLFTDIEGSANLWEIYPKAMRLALERHDTLLRQAIEENNGIVFKTFGDAFCAVFSTATDALRAALTSQLVLLQAYWEETGPLKVRIALHTGEAYERDNDYFGPTVNRIARLQSAGHGQQILLSQATYEHVQYQLPSQTHLRDWGRHRLKDLVEPEHIWQLLHPDLPSEFPPLKTLDTLRNNLEQQITRFIGRTQELSAVKQLLLQSTVVTLTGSGGTGKTRLALQVAADILDDYPDGVWIVELAALSDPSLVPQAVAAVLHVREEPHHTLMQTLLDHLRTQKTLLVLDNCEHLLESCTRVVDTLVRHCPGLSLLMTSREGLNLTGEILYHLPPMRIPEMQDSSLLEKLWDYDACCLFMERIQQQRPDWRLNSQNRLAVVQICRQLDGIPLALELAAAHVSSLGLEQIVQRLADRFRLLIRGQRLALPRQQTLRALVNWSYELLSEKERILFRRLSVFAGSFSLAMVEIVCTGNAISKYEVLELISRLVDKSLVLFEEAGGERGYRLLETLRQYANNALEENLETSHWRGQHRDYFLQLAVEAEWALNGKEQQSWFERLELERDNMRSALDWCMAESTDMQNLLSEQRRMRAERWLKLSSTLERFWYVRGPISEGLRRLEQALQVSHEASDLIRANALNSIGILAAAQGDSEAADQYHLECLTLQRELNNPNGIARSLNNLAIVAEMRGDYGTMRRCLEEGCQIYRELKNPLGYGAILLNLGATASKQEDYMSAQHYFEESLVILRGLDHKLYLGTAFYNLSEVMIQQNKLREAQKYLQESVEIRKDIGDIFGLVQALEQLALLAIRQHHYAPAARWLAAAEVIRDQERFSSNDSNMQGCARAKATIRAQLGDTAFYEALAQGTQLKLIEAVEEALQVGSLVT